MHTVNLMHCSMQFSDRTKNKESDARAIVDYAVRNNIFAVTGTEGGQLHSADLVAALSDQAKRNNYWFYRGAGTDHWMMCKFKPDDHGVQVVVDSQDGAGKHAGRGYIWATFGNIAIMASHFLTEGRAPGNSNYESNVKLANAIASAARGLGHGAGKVFLGVDTNMPDRSRDVFLGNPLTTCWDELGKYPRTGTAATIDVIASYDNDHHVKCVSANVAPINLFSDHEPIIATYQLG